MFKRLIATLLVLTMLLPLGVSALAATTQSAEYRVATASVNVRTGPSSAQYPAIGSLKKGQIVKYLGKDGNWSKISYGDTIGYVFSEYLTDPINQPTKYYRSATTGVNIRSGPGSLQYPVIGTLKKGEKVQYLGDSGSWAMVLYSGDIGFVFGKYLSDAMTDGGGASPEQYRVATANVNIRTGPNSIKYPAIGSLKKGQLIKYLGKSGNWSKISYHNTVGYVFSQYLADPVSQSAPYYRNATANVNVRSGPSSSQYPVIGALKQGEKVQYLGDSGNWAMVLYKGGIGFVFNKYLSGVTTDSGAAAPEQYRIATTNVNVRTGPNSTRYPVMGSLKKGEKVQYLSASGNWSKVLFNGQIGYVFSKYLSK